jgi:hypothetical protein
VTTAPEISRSLCPSEFTPDGNNLFFSLRLCRPAYLALIDRLQRHAGGVERWYWSTPREVERRNGRRLRSSANLVRNRSRKIPFGAQAAFALRAARVNVRRLNLGAVEPD